MTVPVCALAHCSKVDGVWRRGDADRYGVVRQRNGRPAYKARCRRCNTKSGAIPYTVWTEWLLAGAVLEWTETKDGFEACSVAGCRESGTELHHFGPRNTFGAEADDWPVLPLCVTHHLSWHRMMDGYRWHARAAV